MSKLRAPMMSLGAQGTLADEVTFTRRRKATVAENKPETPNMRTLPQVYQRWLYQDYVYLWSKQTAATRAAYAAKASRVHTTALAEWLRYCLTTLPFIRAIFHLDEISGNIAHDLSSYHNDAIIVGASPTIGEINGGFHFDGYDDNLSIGAAKYDALTDCTLELFLNPKLSLYTKRVFSAYKNATNEVCLVHSTATKYVSFGVSLAGVYRYVATNIPAPLAWAHYAGQLGSSGIRLYLNGVQQTQTWPLTWSFNSIAPTVRNTIGGYTTSGNTILGDIDHVILWDILLDETMIKNHAARRYP